MVDVFWGVTSLVLEFCSPLKGDFLEWQKADALKVIQNQDHQILVNAQILLRRWREDDDDT